MSKKDCIFCKIINHDIPSKIVFEDNNTLAFLDIFPISKGHTIVIPKNHYNNIEDIPEDELSNIIKVVKKIAIILHDKLNLEGYNILQNNFQSAGQIINHFHFHIIPRDEHDKRFELRIPRNQTAEEDLIKVLELIKENELTS